MPNLSLAGFFLSLFPAWHGSIILVMDKKKRVSAYLYNDIYLKHKTGNWHPESPKRLTAINNKINAAEWYKDLVAIKPKPADIETAKKNCADGMSQLRTGDTEICKNSFDVALNAVGGAMLAVDAVFGGKAKNAFYEDGTVYYMSTRQSPSYPGTGKRDETGDGKGKGRIVSLLEGGYNLQGMASAVHAHVDELSKA